MEGKLTADQDFKDPGSEDPGAEVAAQPLYADFVIEARGGIEIKSKGVGECSGPIYICRTTYVNEFVIC